MEHNPHDPAVPEDDAPKRVRNRRSVLKAGAAAAAALIVPDCVRAQGVGDGHRSSMSGRNPSNPSQAANLDWALPSSVCRTVTASSRQMLNDAVILCDATSAGFTVTLLSPAPALSFPVTIKKIDATSNLVTLTGTVDGVVNPTLSAGAYVTIISDGVAWHKTGQLELLFRVTDFGAKGNGVADDTASIQAALNSAGAAGGGAVMIPPGHFNITHIAIPAWSISLCGAGPRATWLNGPPGLRGPLISGPRGAQLNFARVAHLSISGHSRADVGSIGLDFTDISNGEIDQIEITNVETGLLLRSVAGTCYYNKISDLLISGVGAGVSVTNGANENWFFGASILTVSGIAVKIDLATNVQFYGVNIEGVGTGYDIGASGLTTFTKVFGSRIDEATVGVNIHANAARTFLCALHYASCKTPIIDTSASHSTVVLIDVAGRLLLNCGTPTAPQTQMEMRADDGGVLARQLVLSGLTNPLKALYVGVDTTSATMRASIQAIEQGRDGRELALNPAGGVVSTPASTATSSGFRISPGIAPKSPVDGDIWYDGMNLNIRIHGVTKNIV